MGPIHYGLNLRKSTHRGEEITHTYPLNPQRSAALRYAPLRCAPLHSASLRSTSLRSAPLRTAPLGAAPLAGSFVSEKVAMYERDRMRRYAQIQPIVP